MDYHFRILQVSEPKKQPMLKVFEVGVRCPNCKAVLSLGTITRESEDGVREWMSAVKPQITECLVCHFKFIYSRYDVVADQRPLEK